MVSGSGGGGPLARAIQITNIAPQATKDQMQTLFGCLGRVEEIRLYPTVRDVACPVQSRVCYVRFAESAGAAAAVAAHLTNTVFIDRALLVAPAPGPGPELPDEARALQLVAPPPPSHAPHLISALEGEPPNQLIQSRDPRLQLAGLPPYPPLPAAYTSVQVDEIRRTLLAIDLHPDLTSQQLIQHFNTAGQVKYVRFCGRDSDKLRYALVEFSEQDSILKGLKLNGSIIEGHSIKVHHATQAIIKPQAKSNEAAQKEIEEAMCRVKEAQNLISAAIDPVIGLLSKDKRRSRSRSRSRSRRSRRSRSRSRHHSRRSRSRSRRRRHRSRSRSSRHRSHSRRSRSYGKSSRSKRDRSRNRDKDKEKERDKPPKKEEKEKAVSIEKESSVEKKRSPSKEKRRSRSKERKSRDRKLSKSRERDRKRSRSREKRERRSRSRGKRRSRSRERKRSRSRERKRSRSRDRKRSKSRERKRSRSAERKRSKSADRKRSHSKNGSKSQRAKSPSVDMRNRESRDRDDQPKVARDYDEEDRGFEADCASGKSEEYSATPDARGKDSPDNMDISNSP